MKILYNFYIVAVCLICESATNAQVMNSGLYKDKSVQKSGTVLARRAAGLQSVLQKQYLSRQENRKKAAARTTGAGERLLAFGGYNLLDTSFLPSGKSDSGYYFYSGSAGSVFNYQMMDFAAPSFATYTSPADEDYPLSLTWNPGSSAIPQVELFPDSAYSWNSFYPSGASAGFGFAAICSYQYSGNNILQTNNRYYPDLPGEMTRIVYYYNSLGNLTASLYYIYDSSLHTWDTANATSFFYNGLNQLVMDSAAVNDGSGLCSEDSKNVYTFDGSGNLVFTEYYTDSMGYWQPQTIRNLYYSADSTLQADSMSQYNVGLWTPYIKDSFGYIPGVAYFTFDQTEMFISDSVWSKCTYSKNVAATGLPDTLYYSFFGGGVPVSEQISGKKTFFTYDSLNNPLMAKSFDFNLSDTLSGAGSYNANPERIFYYYYESYNVTKVPDAATAPGRLVIYPNPAADVVSISRPDAVQGAITIITISNAMGQKISVESMPWMSETETIALAGLVPGLYLLSLQDGNGNVIATQKIVKQ